MTEFAINNLEKRRKELGLSRHEAAVGLRMTDDYYGKVERGARIPGAQYNGLFESVFDCPYKDLFPQFYQHQMKEDELED